MQCFEFDYYFSGTIKVSIFFKGGEQGFIQTLSDPRLPEVKTQSFKLKSEKVTKTV